MEFFLKSKDNAFPCEVTIDEDNGRYTIRKSDSSGEVFNSARELAAWILNNWGSDDFTDKEQYESMLKEIQRYLPLIH
ncbi:hypothetical protein CVD25_13320 [Bacillus canaveralius]|uniref:Threonine dehydratase n=1 Tax=Bacillus canaveralius TaxID=1403243 RepID=A0A2N5GGJ8_9BACI|nr:hypothetical protein [Bacillus canaveralius]PLR79884.1 hypothetical protein CU635_20620 [Bacillus canaveralius]PLR96027.1 hypothetical protein CVD25_13320 [Bacillus canaveralius]RSK51606.1 hypothetical protein EJA13_13905 [Bacillus canaveralius]